MSTTIYAVYGASGFGREVMPLIKAQYPDDDAQFVFIDDGEQQDILNGYFVWSYQQLLQHPAVHKNIIIAIANSPVREKLALRCEQDGLTLISVFAPHHVQMDAVDAQEGLILCPFTTLTSNIRIGRHVHLNIYSYIAHDCIIGNFVTFAPRVSCNGNVIIEDHAYIGTGAVIKQGTPDKPLIIGRGAVVGMGAVVTKSVPAGVTVVGNPARPFVK